MTRVLLTGAGGFIGSHVFRHLLVSTDWDIVAVDSFRHRGVTDRLTVQARGVAGWRKRTRVVTHDLRAPLSRQAQLAIGHPDYVLHLASESSVDRSIKDPRPFCENNVAVTLTMLELARVAAPRKFIQVSTDEVYGPAVAGQAHAEGEPHRPSNPYAASKACQEDLAHAWWRTYGLRLAVVNAMNVVGEMQDPEKFVPMTLKKVLAAQTVPIHASADGLTVGSRFYIHARNVADALVHLLREAPFPAYGEGEMGRWNVAGEREVSNLEMAHLIAGFAGRDLRYELTDFHSSRPGHDLRYALDASKLAAAGWKPPLHLEASLAATVAWTMEHRDWLA